jgi:hypothetical protein
MTSSLGTTVTNLDDRRRCASRGGELGKGLVLTEGYPHHIPTSKSQPAACLLPGIDTSGGREWFNPNRVWTARRGVNGHLGIRLRGQGFSGLVDRSYSGWVPVGW